MTRLPREPLDTDERALAARLPRLHGRDEPDATLDARILAAAHAALAPARVTKRRRGWIVPLTAAASVSLAVGLAWQLQPPPAPMVVPASAPVAAASEASDGGQASVHAIEAAPSPAEDVAQSMTMPSPARQQAPPASDAARIAHEALPAEPAAEARAAAPMFVPPPPPASMADAMPVASAPPPAPPAPPAPVTVQGAMARSAAADVGASATGAAMPAQAKRGRQNEADADAEASTLDTFDKAMDEEDVPPATMNAPAARDAWLRRIGELQQQGRIDDAKASLTEFRRRYPDALLPPELRKLEP